MIRVAPGFAVAALVLALPNLPGQGLRIPLTGFVVERESRSIRPINGLPGASQLGEPLALPIPVALAEFSRRSDFALVIADSPERRVVLVRDLSETPSLQTLDEAIPDVDLLALNESGTGAVLYSSTSKRLQFVSGAPDAPQVSAPVSLASLPGRVTALALAASGLSALVAATDGISGGVYEIGSGPSSLPLASFSAYRPSAVVYLNGDRDIAYADVFSNQIVLIRDVNGSREARVLASEADRIQTPIALRGIEGALIVANAGTATLVRCDLLTGATSTLATLPVVPGRLQSLSFPGLLLLNEPGAGPLYLYSTEDSSLLFVPRPAGPVRGHRPTPSLRRSK